MNVIDLGRFIRDQRTRAKLSLRSMSGLAGVSIPYLSQVERGLRKPSAEILQAIAKGLRISAETLYVQAGILEDRASPDVAAAIMTDKAITERQKQALLQIYEAFREETGSRSKRRGKPKPGFDENGSALRPAPTRQSGTGGSRTTSTRGVGGKTPSTREEM